MRKVIHGEAVTLRPITYEDTDLIVKWRNNERVRQNFIYRGMLTKEIHRHWMDTLVAHGSVVQYIIEYDGRPVGSVYYRNIDLENRSAEFGIFIGEDDAVGNGVGTEATRLFLDFGMNELMLHRICLRLLPHNKSAYRLYVSAGFRTEGIFREMAYIDGKYHDVIFMAILNQDY